MDAVSKRLLDMLENSDSEAFTRVSSRDFCHHLLVDRPQSEEAKGEILLSRVVDARQSQARMIPKPSALNVVPPMSCLCPRGSLRNL